MPKIDHNAPIPIQRVQHVHLGITRTGQHGYFTGYTLAVSLSPEEFHQSYDWHKEHCRLLGFVFDVPT